MPYLGEMHSPRWSNIEPVATDAEPITLCGSPEAIARFALALQRGCGHTDGVSPSPAPVCFPGEVASAPEPVRAVVAMDEAIARWKDEMTARGVRGSSIARFAAIIARAQKHCGWANTDQVDYLSAVAFLSFHRRGEHGGKAWGPSAHNQAVTVLRTFGEYMRRAKFCGENKLEDLQTWKQAGGKGCRALTVDEARKIVAVAIARQSKDSRAHGCAALFWTTLFLTGLRYAEACSLIWGDVVLDGAIPCIRTRPGATGNKAGRADFIPLHAELVGLLKQWRMLVAHGERQPVFAVTPTRTTWRMDRDDAGIQPMDARGRKTSVHACRKSFCTWIDRPGLSSGQVAALARHATTMTERRYIDRGEEELYEAVQHLPCLWPPGQGDLAGIWKKTPDSSSGLDTKTPIVYGVDASPTHDNAPNHNTAVSSDGHSKGVRQGWRSEEHSGRPSLHPALPESPTSEIEAAFGLRPVTLITGLNIARPATDEVALVLALWLKSRLTGAPDGSHDGTGVTKSQSPQPPAPRP